MSLCTACVLCGALLASASPVHAAAQALGAQSFGSQTAIVQSGGPQSGGEQTGVDQIGGPPDFGATEVEGQLTSAVRGEQSPPAQLTPRWEARPPPAPPPRADANIAPSQLNSAGRTAEPTRQLSSRAQGRVLAAGAVGGRDRCDARLGGPQPAGCERVIERRAGEFAAGPAPAPVALSPEQRLLAQQPSDVSADSAARRLNRGEVEGSMGAEGVAAAYAQQQQDAQTKAAAQAVTGLTADQSAIVTAIVGQLAGQAVSITPTTAPK